MTLCLFPSCKTIAAEVEKLGQGAQPLVAIFSELLMSQPASHRVSPALEKVYQFLLWLIPTLDKFPRRAATARERRRGARQGSIKPAVVLNQRPDAPYHAHHQDFGGKYAMARKEMIKPPNRKELKDASKRRFSEFASEPACNQEYARALEQGLDDEAEPVVAQSQPAVLHQPGKAALDRPASLPQP